MEAFLATPSYSGQLCCEYQHSMAATLGELFNQNIRLQQQVKSGNPFVDRARNELVSAFLASAATDLLFIDDDVGWDARAVTRVLSYSQEIVAGLVPKRDPTNESDFHQNALTGLMQDGLFQSLEAPTAFMRIKRSVFEKLDRAYPHYKTMDSASRDIPYFQTGIYQGGFVGEDIFFCRQWCALGEFLWIDSDISFTHRGSKVWRGNFYDHAVKTGLLKTS